MRQLKSLLAIALLQPILALPLMALLFFVLPRTQFPLWHGLNKAGVDNPGISDSIQPGDKSSISSNKGVVFRAEMPQLAPNSLYWRVFVLNSFQQESWIRRQPPGSEFPLVRRGNTVYQTIFLEPGKQAYLPALDIPRKISSFRGSATPDQLFQSGTYNRRRTYEAESQTGGNLTTAKGVNRRFYTTLPDSIPERLRVITDKITKEERTDQQRINSLEKFFINLNLSYTNSDLPTGTDAVDTFLFKEKKGHCELFAASFALALRMAGIPARLVAGYYGGDYNELAGYYIITAERSHVWVELWLDGNWVTVDPSRFAANFAESSARKSSPAMLRLTLFLDTLAYYWNRMVITYDLESQFSLISSSGAWMRNFTLSSLPWKKAGVVTFILITASGGLYLLSRARRPAEEKLLQKFVKVVKARFGVIITPFAGLHEALHEVNDASVREFIEIYTGALYRDRLLTVDEIAMLKMLLTKIRKG